jgi:NADH-quinone oxidoreductase subunit L
MIGVFVTAFYSMRLLFMTFHGKPRWQQDAHAGHGHEAAHGAAHSHGDEHETHAEPDHGHHGGPPHESPWVVTLPLILLAIPSIIIGALTVKPLLFGGGFGESIFFNEAHHEALREIGEEFGNWWSFVVSAFAHPVVYLVGAGVLAAYALYVKWPHLPDVIDSKLKPLRWILERKYGFDWFNENVLAAGGRLLGRIFWKAGDTAIIDGVVVDGSAKTIGFVAGIVRRVQSGFLYSYAFWMVIGLAVMLGWFLTR